MFKCHTETPVACLKDAKQSKAEEHLPIVVSVSVIHIIQTQCEPVYVMILESTAWVKIKYSHHTYNYLPSPLCLHPLSFFLICSHLSTPLPISSFFLGVTGRSK